MEGLPVLPQSRRSPVRHVVGLICLIVGPAGLSGCATGKRVARERVQITVTPTEAETTPILSANSASGSGTPAVAASFQTATGFLPAATLPQDGELLPVPVAVAGEDEIADGIAGDTELLPPPRSDDASPASESVPNKDRQSRDSDRPMSLLDGLLPGDDSGTATENTDALQLPQVVQSVQSFFPLLQSVYLERNRTAGDQLAAWGEFDTKLKGYTENQPIGFYENYQHGAGIVQPRYGGGEVFGGYRVGRGQFEPWYEERDTNAGGEFKVGFDVPLVRDHDIDKRRADLWRATYDRQLAEPEIRQQLIGFVFDASVSYWVWVAAGQQYRIGLAALDLAERRNVQVAERVKEGDLPPPDLSDNDRAIAVRKAKLLDLQRKLEQSAVKLSLFVRDGDTIPLIPPAEALPRLPDVPIYDAASLESDIASAVSRRPEIVALDVQYRRTEVDLAQAYNDTLPMVDAMMNASQDMGKPTSSSRDKSPLELEVGLEFEMPLQQRKGRGKMRSARAKLQQLALYRNFTIEKVATEVRVASAALVAASQRVEQTIEAVKLADQLARIEREKFVEGESDLLAVFLREQFAIEAADELVLTKLEYFVARAQYDAALAAEFPTPVFIPVGN